MKNMYPIYRNINDWAILETRIIHNYDECETPIEIVLVLVGTLHYEGVDFNHLPENKRTPIIRWITRKEYNRLMEYEGEIVW